jgi:hypothetical protein
MMRKNGTRFALIYYRISGNSEIRTEITYSKYKSWKYDVDI